MAKYESLMLEKALLEEKVTKNMSKWSESLRSRLGKITDYKQDMEKTFDGFVENTLPKDDLYF